LAFNRPREVKRLVLVRKLRDCTQKTESRETGKIIGLFTVALWETTSREKW